MRAEERPRGCGDHTVPLILFRLPVLVVVILARSLSINDSLLK